MDNRNENTQLPEATAESNQGDVGVNAGAQTNTPVPAEANPGQSAFFKELTDLPPKPATIAPGATDSAPPPDSSAPQPAKDIKDFFGKDFLKNIMGKKTVEPEAEVQPEETAQATPSGDGASAGNTDQPRTFFPKDDAPPEEEKIYTPPADVQDNYIFVEEMKNTAAAFLLAMRSGTPAKMWTLDEDQVARLAKAAAKMKVKWIENMDGGTQYLVMNAMIYGPMVMKAEQIRAQNIKNLRLSKMPYKQDLKESAGDYFTPKPSGTVIPLQAERTRYEIHGNGTYMYARTVPGQKAEYLKVNDPKCEKVDLSDIEALKRVILKVGSWKKTARILEVSEQWMTERGLNTNNPE